MSTPGATPLTNRTELEALIRQIVREELARVVKATKQSESVLDDWSHEGPDDPKGDSILLREALTALAELEKNPRNLMTLDELEEELDRAEAAGELPGRV
jgi:hypothetical protein